MAEKNTKPEKDERSSKLIGNLISCSNCKKLSTELKQCKEDLSRAIEQMNARFKQLQGKIERSKSSEQLRKEFDVFFTETIDKKVGSLTETDRIVLCDRFQVTYQYVFKYLLGCGRLSQKLNDLFKVSVIETQEFESLKCTYGMLVSISGITGTCPITPDVLGFEHKCLGEDILQLAWGLATAVPPLVPSCEPQKRNKKEHDILDEHGQRNMSDTLKYTRPILYRDCLGDTVLVKGQVIDTNSSAETDL